MFLKILNFCNFSFTIIFTIYIILIFISYRVFIIHILSYSNILTNIFIPHDFILFLLNIKHRRLHPLPLLPFQSHNGSVALSQVDEIDRTFDSGLHYLQSVVVEVETGDGFVLCPVFDHFALFGVLEVQPFVSACWN